MHFNSAGIYYEQEESLVAGPWRDENTIALALRDALGKFEFREISLRDEKKTDWPALRASKCRSVREFEKEYLKIRVCALNEAELFYDASAQPRTEADISLHVTLNPYGTDLEMGRLLIKLFDACLRWHVDEV
jgi:hypothetical protein